jgi:YidC/Oxa1 family membrane protein insertase
MYFQTGGKKLGFLYSIFGTLLGYLYNFLGDYALSIIAFTLITKVLLLPLYMAQMKSTKAMSAVQPELKKLQAKYKDDKETLNIKTMELYKKFNVNPLAGCLPLIIQLPIIFALFGTLRDPQAYVFAGDAVRTAEALGQGFFWITDLSKPDMLSTFIPALTALPVPIPGVLPIVAAGLTYVQTKTMSVGKEQNDQMKTMNMMMPFMILFFGISMASGVLIYWVVGNVFQIGQQLYTNKLSKEGA